MRKVKFRAWDVDQKIMLYSDFNAMGFYSKENPNEIAENTETVFMYHEYTGEKDFVLMQSTGLKDINGIDIYEGDLVEHEMEVNGLWEPYEACKVVFDGDIGIYCFDWDSPNLLSDYKNLKVIGNTYENPRAM